MDKCSRPVARNTGAWLGLSQSHETMKCVPGSQGRGGGGTRSIHDGGGGGSDQFFFGGGGVQNLHAQFLGQEICHVFFLVLKKYAYWFGSYLRANFSFRVFVVCKCGTPIS